MLPGASADSSSQPLSGRVCSVNTLRPRCGPTGWDWVRNFWFRLAHLVTIGFVIVQTWLGQLCPLTIWEQQLRAAAGHAVHDQSFIEFWLSRILFFDLPWWVFIAAYTAFGLIVLLSWWRYPPRWSRGFNARRSA